jgi:hypothetical protein
LLDLLLSLPSHAIILGGTAQESDDTLDVSVEVIEPAPIGQLQIGAGKFEGTDVFGLNEKQNFILEESINIFDFYNFNNPTPVATIPLSEGSVYSSHMIWVDPPGEGFLGGNGRRYNWEGQIEFKDPIVGIIPRSIIVEPSIPETNKIFGLDNVDYTGTQSLDNVVDIVTWDNNILDFKLAAGDGTDHFRVITATSAPEAAPEPLTILGSTLALGFGAFFKKKYDKKQIQTN